MSAYVFWLVPKRVLYVDFRGDVSVETMRTTMEHCASYLAECNERRRTHVVINTTSVDRFPSNMIQIRRSMMPYFYSPALGWTVLACRTPKQRYLFQITANLFHSQFHSVDWMLSGLQFLQSADETLGPIRMEPYARVAID